MWTPPATSQTGGTPTCRKYWTKDVHTQTPVFSMKSHSPPLPFDSVEDIQTKYKIKIRHVRRVFTLSEDQIKEDQSRYTPFGIVSGIHQYQEGRRLKRENKRPKVRTE